MQNSSSELAQLHLKPLIIFTYDYYHTKSCYEAKQNKELVYIPTTTIVSPRQGAKLKAPN